MDLKYKPTDITQFLGHHDNISSILQWFDNTSSQALILTAPFGSGKTTLADIAVNLKHKESHYFISSLITKKFLFDKIKIIRNTFFSQNNIIIIDNIEDLSFVSIPEIKKHSNIPLLFIGTKCPSKLSKKNFLKIELKTPYKKDILKFLQHIINIENIHISNKKLLLLIKQYQCDIRGMLVFLSNTAFNTKTLFLQNDRFTAKYFFENTLPLITIDLSYNTFIRNLLFENYMNYSSTLEQAFIIIESLSIEDTFNYTYSPYIINSLSFDTSSHNIRNSSLQHLTIKINKNKKNNLFY